jgi:hypothetical protein
VAERNAKVILDADVSRFNRAVLGAAATTRAFTKELDTSTDRAANLTQGLLAIGPALVPIASAAVPALAGLSNQLAMTAGAAGVAVLAFSGVGEALKAVNEFQIDPTAANLEKLEETMASLGPAGRDFVTYLQSIRPELQRLQDAAQEGIFPGLQVGISELMTQLPQAERIVSEIAEALGTLGAEAGTALAGPRWEEFFNFLEAEAKPTLLDMGRTVGNLADGFAQLWMAFAPTSANFSDSFLRMSREFAGWASTVDQTQGFQDFLAYLDRVGPKVWETLGALGNALLQVAEAAAPVGEAALPIIEFLADSVAAIADSDVGPVLIGVAAGISAISRAVMLYNVAQGGALASLLGGTAVGGAARSARDLRGATSAYLDFGAALGAAGPQVGAFATTTERLRASLGGVGRLTAGLGALAFAASDLDDNLGLANTAMFTLAGAALGPWGAAAGAAIGITRDLAASTDGLSTALDNANRAADGGTIEQRRAAMEALREEVEKAQAGEAGFGQRIADWAESASPAIPFVTGLAAGVDRFTKSSSEAASELTELEKQHAAAEDAAQEQAFEEAGLETAMFGASDAARDQAEALLESAEAMNAKRDATLESLDAELAYEAAIDDAAKAAREGRDGIDKDTAAGRENRALLYDLAAAWNNLTPAQQAAAGEAERARKSFIDSAIGMGASKRQAQDLADQLLDIPPAVETKVETPGATKAVEVLKALQRAINNISPFKDVTIRTTRENVTKNIKVEGGTQVAMADGGLVRGPGGPRDDVIPALLSNGEYVVNAAATARNLPLLERLNAQRFADGGLASRRADVLASARPVSVRTSTTVSLADAELSASIAGAKIGVDKNGLLGFIDGRIELHAQSDAAYSSASNRAGGRR